jgi:hypothetical protein
MTTISATAIHHPRVSSTWVIAFLAMLVAGLTAALVISLTSGSSPAAPASPAQPLTTTSGTAGQPAPALCPGSVKDWSC